MPTFDGANVDIFIEVSEALVAWISTRGNLIHAEIPNLMTGTFPFLFIPEFFVPLAIALHALAIKAIIIRLRAAA